MIKPKVGGYIGDGYEGRDPMFPHTKHEVFEGLNVLDAAEVYHELWHLHDFELWHLHDFELWHLHDLELWHLHDMIKH